MRVRLLLLIPQRYEFSSKSQQLDDTYSQADSCCWYHKGTNFQANHNIKSLDIWVWIVVADTTKVRIFKQITTYFDLEHYELMLLLIPQRYEFSSKSQLQCCYFNYWCCCCWYHKGTNFQANHNVMVSCLRLHSVVADTTKVRIFKQITTCFVLVHS